MAIKGPITAEEFERRYVERSGMSPEAWRIFRDRDREIVAACHCGDEMCEGWQMTSLEGLRDEARLNRLTPQEVWEALRR